MQEGYIKKITVKGIGCDVIAQTQPTSIMQIYGRASGLKSEPYEKDDPDSDVWTCLVGDFEAVNLQTQERFRSARLFLPSGIQDIIEVAVQRLGDTGQKDIIFALELQTMKASNKAGYTYRAINLLPPKEADDPMFALRKELEELQLQRALPAAAADTKALPAGAPAKKGGR